MNKYIGIDPGKSGGISMFYNGKIRAVKCPPTFQDMNIAFLNMKGNTSSDNIYVFIEQVWAFPSDSSKTAFTFGTNYGAWQTICEIEECNITLVRPRKWQSYFETPKSEKKVRKRWLKELAQKSCDFRVTFNTSDAILIGQYCKELKGKL